MSASVAVLEAVPGRRDVSVRFFDDGAFGHSMTVSFSDAGAATDCTAADHEQLIAKARDIARMIVDDQVPSAASE